MLVRDSDLYCFQARRALLEKIPERNRREAFEALFATGESIDSILNRCKASFTVSEHALIKVIQSYLRFTTDLSVPHLTLLGKSIQLLWHADTSLALDFLQATRFPGLYGAVCDIKPSGDIDVKSIIDRINRLLAKSSPVFSLLRTVNEQSLGMAVSLGLPTGDEITSELDKARFERIKSMWNGNCTEADLNVIDDPVLFYWHVEFLYYASRSTTGLSVVASMRLKDVVSHSLRDSEFIQLALVVLCNDLPSKSKQSQIRDLSAIHKLRIYGNPCGPADTHFLSRSLRDIGSTEDFRMNGNTAVCISGQARGFLSTLPRLLKSFSTGLRHAPFVSVATWVNPGVNMRDHGAQLFRHFPSELYGTINSTLLQQYFPLELESLINLNSTLSVQEGLESILQGLASNGLIAGYALKVTDERDLPFEYVDRQHEIFVKFFYNFCLAIDNISEHERLKKTLVETLLWSRPDLNVYFKSIPQVLPSSVYALNCSWPFGPSDFLLMGRKDLFQDMVTLFRDVVDIKDITSLFGYASIPLAIGKFFFSKGIAAYPISQENLQQEQPLLLGYSFSRDFLCDLFHLALSEDSHLKDVPELASFLDALNRCKT